MIEIRQTERFRKWFLALRDRRAQQIIAKRLVRVEAGMFGDAKSIGNRVSELKIACGPGYRLYFTRRDIVTVVLLCGGDKSSQARDIKTAQKTESELENEDNGI
jgi:putative addiction module killer protein